MTEPVASFAQRLGANLRELRGHRGWTQREPRAGKSQGTRYRCNGYHFCLAGVIEVDVR